MTRMVGVLLFYRDMQFISDYIIYRNVYSKTHTVIAANQWWNRVRISWDYWILFPVHWGYYCVGWPCTNHQLLCFSLPIGQMDNTYLNTNPHFLGYLKVLWKYTSIIIFRIQCEILLHFIVTDKADRWYTYMTSASTAAFKYLIQT